MATREQRFPTRTCRLPTADASTNQLWNELNDSRNRPTPAVTVEAIMHVVRERGVAALKNDPATVERLARCDKAAMAQINERIAKLKEAGRIK